MQFTKGFNNPIIWLWDNKVTSNNLAFWHSTQYQTFHIELHHILSKQTNNVVLPGNCGRLVSSGTAGINK